MTERFVDISESPARLRIRQGLLEIEPEAGQAVGLSLSEIAGLVIAHPRVSFTQAVLVQLAEAGAILVVCDERRLPTGMLMPLRNHHLQAKLLQHQAEASRPLKKRLWQRLVKTKIAAQARLLTAVTGDDAGLTILSSAVRSGDPNNMEAQAARRYWSRIFGSSFRRNVDAMDQNRHLNYGYAVLRGMVSRAICASGLHPSLGLHHHHRNNAFCLADDLMEPYRPIVDQAVYEWEQVHDPEDEFDREAKNHLLNVFTGTFSADGQQRTLFDILSRVTGSLSRVFLEQQKSKDWYLPCLLQ